MEEGNYRGRREEGRGGEGEWRHKEGGGGVAEERERSEDSWG